MPRIAHLVTIATFVALAAGPAGAVELSARSTGAEWVVADAGQRQRWTAETAGVVHTEGGFAEAVGMCLSEALIEDGVEPALHDELMRSELSELTWSCITLVEHAGDTEKVLEATAE